MEVSLRILLEDGSEREFTSRVRVVRGRVIHAGPTVGKSTLMTALNTPDQVRILDTDSLYEPLFGDSIWDEMPFLKSSDSAAVLANWLLNRGLWSTVSTCLDACPGGVILTNVYGRAATVLMDDWLEDGKFPISFFREPEDMLRLARKRDPKGKGFDTNLVEKWYTRWRDARPGKVNIILGEGEYLADVIAVRDSSWWGETPILENWIRSQVEFDEGEYPGMDEDVIEVVRNRAVIDDSTQHRRLLVKVGEGSIATWVKLSFTDDLISGFEVYGAEPGSDYWVENYGHDKPRVVPITEPVAFELTEKFGSRRWLHLWPSMNNDPTSGVEPTGNISDKAHTLGSDELQRFVSTWGVAYEPR